MKKTPFKTLAIDNSSRKIGWSFFYDKELHDFNLIELRGINSDDRLVQYFHAMNKLLTLWYPDMVVIESPFVNPRFMKSCMVLFEYFGILKLLCNKQNLPYIIISPTGAKKGLTGKGNAKKEDVQREVRKKYNILPDRVLGFDEADSIAVGHTFLLTKQF